MILIGACVNTNNGATDSMGDNCVDWYDEYPEDCGKYDDNDFKAEIVCCACGGIFLANSYVLQNSLT